MLCRIRDQIIRRILPTQEELLQQFEAGYLVLDHAINGTTSSKENKA